MITILSVPSMPHLLARGLHYNREQNVAVDVYSQLVWLVGMSP